MTGVLLVNLGTPDHPTTRAVRRFLRQFLSDPKVIGINPISRHLLVNLIILPFRPRRSAAAYQKIWTGAGSPLLVHTEALGREVSKRLGQGYVVEIGMRYGNPSIRSGLERIVQRGVEEIRLLPLFPQYASASFGSAEEEVRRVAREIPNVPPIRTIPPFYNHPGFIKGLTEVGRPVLERVRPDHILMSFHGLPVRQIEKGDPYLSQCQETARLLAKALNLPEGATTVSFQSRLGRTAWIRPYTDQVVIDLAKQGNKNIIVFCPAFVTDCLETLEEIGIRARESALQHGAESLELVPSLNTDPRWVETVCEMVVMR